MQSKRTTPPCRQCGHPVGPNKQREPKRFCSRACHYASRSTVPPTTCAACGAPISGGKPSERRRFCSQQCYRALTVPIADRFWPKVNKNGPTIRLELGPCWPWTGATDGHGYGRIGRGRADEGNVGAHVVSWEIHRGPVPDGLFVLHHCDNPPCVRPDHLFVGTIQDNSDDMKAKGRSAGAHKGSANHGAILNEALVQEMRRRHAAGGTIAAVARACRVAYMPAWYAITGRTWQHVK
jgi:endogenous inhibitor of DNA gyrase (YacG/DUF329 family)